MDNSKEEYLTAVAEALMVEVRHLLEEEVEDTIKTIMSSMKKMRPNINNRTIINPNILVSSMQKMNMKMSISMSSERVTIDRDFKRSKTLHPKMKMMNMAHKKKSIQSRDQILRLHSSRKVKEA